MEVDNRLVVRKSGAIVRFNPHADQTLIKRGLEAIESSPDLIEIQRLSFDQFLQKEVPPEKREEIGLQAVFNSIFTITDYEESTLLECVKYDFGEPNYTPEECREKRETYSAPLWATLCLVVFDTQATGHATGWKRCTEIKEQRVYLGEIPLMTADGTFIIAFEGRSTNVTSSYRKKEAEQR